MKLILFMAFGLVLTGCTTNVTVEGSVPTPLVKKIPASVGVYYADSFKSFQHEESIEQRGTWKVDLGDQNLSFFRNLFQAMFTSVKEVGEEPPLAKGQMNKLDGVIVPRIVKYGFLTPDISGLNFYSASIEYQITVYDHSGKRISTWNVVGYGKSEAGMFGRDDALGDATMQAIRDGGARIAIELADQPGVKQWLASNEERQNQSDEDAGAHREE